jgi:hypothetical protein
MRTNVAQCDFGLGLERKKEGTTGDTSFQKPCTMSTLYRLGAMMKLEHRVKGFCQIILFDLLLGCARPYRLSCLLLLFTH